MSTINLLYRDEYPVDKDFTIYIPKVGEILDNEDGYYDLVTKFTAMPIDFMVPLEDAGIDFTSIDAYKLFLMFFPKLVEQDTSLIFKNLDLSRFQFAENEDTGAIFLIDPRSDIRIDRIVHGKIAGALRRIHNLERDNRKPANKEAKDFMLEIERRKLKRRKNTKRESQLESLIIAMVNTEQFKYGFEGTRELSIYQFNESVRQIIKKVDYDHKMSGVYAGTVSVKDLSHDDLNWLTHKK